MCVIQNILGLREIFRASQHLQDLLQRAYLLYLHILSRQFIEFSKGCLGQKNQS